MADNDKPIGDLESSLGDISKAAEGVAAATAGDGEGAASIQAQGLGFLADVALSVTVEVGRAKMTIQDILQLGQGSVIELSKLAGEPLDIFVNHKQVARGEAVIVNEKFGVRLTDIIAPEDRIGSVVK